ncbi:MAG: hypothetical protein K0U60_01365 [Actinomycetia bacterium]|nr:hypothetical protein [Actinomycetes bacterium]MCH9800516.1 hypothetical protein [Actinomycetes bacterium]
MSTRIPTRPFLVAAFIFAAGLAAGFSWSLLHKNPRSAYLRQLQQDQLR